MIFVLPVLVLALMRRLNADERAARQLDARARSDKLAQDRIAAETAAEAARSQEIEPPEREDLEEGDGPDLLERDVGPP